QVQSVARQLREMLGSAPVTGGTPPSAIVPWIIGDEGEAVAHASGLRDRGVFVPAIRFPTVARGSARLRFTATAGHTAADLAELSTALLAQPLAAFSK
ncbi:MAG TPA: aminotransferase class I/II-fold pyridoxal phosphate-dependent enzyme, partial [Candidatus Limnocylindria bacterium]|nr:aminotransferase class I/II-fold pyridoxal phosphate-dependent enzyme [Candidatus Limnocylindria bacterium]